MPVECGHGSDFVLASPCSPRVPMFLVVLEFHGLLCSKCHDRNSWLLAMGSPDFSSAIGSPEWRSVQYCSEDRNSQGVMLPSC